MSDQLIYNAETNAPIKEISVDDIPLDKLKSIITPKKGDSLLYLGYILEKSQLEELNKKLSNILAFDFSRYFYVLECHGIYKRRIVNISKICK